MSLKKILLFIDYANINRAAKDNNIKLDYAHLKDHLSIGRELLEAYCYIPINPNDEHKYDKEMEILQEIGYFVTTKRGTSRGGTYKCNMDIEMTIDMIRTAHIVKPDVVILASGDGDFAAVLDELRKLGIRAEVAAFKSTMSKQLRLRASAFIDLFNLFKPGQDAPEMKQNKRCV
jgi:uncharacterized LabA/DUF88 family protein